MFALGGQIFKENKKKFMKIAHDLTETCVQMYLQTSKHVGPEDINFKKPAQDYGYYLRPEAIESVFYMWRYTKNEYWRKVAWEIFLGINQTCRTLNGFSTVQITETTVIFNDKQESFWLSETLKYFLFNIF